MGIPAIDTGPMTVKEFYAFTDGRPDEEKWELIDGEAVLNASPSELHQRILKNVLLAIGVREQAAGTLWEVLPSLGVRVSDIKRPEPDLLIVPRSPSLDPTRKDRNDVLVAFEILSPSTASRDLKWKRSAYASLDALMHYVVIAQDTTEVIVFSRSDEFGERRYRSVADEVVLDPPGVSLRLAQIYRNTGI